MSGTLSNLMVFNYVISQIYKRSYRLCQQISEVMNPSKLTFGYILQMLGETYTLIFLYALTHWGLMTHLHVM